MDIHSNESRLVPKQTIKSGFFVGSKLPENIVATRQVTPRSLYDMGWDLKYYRSGCPTPWLVITALLHDSILGIQVQDCAQDYGCANANHDPRVYATAPAGNAGNLSTRPILVVFTSVMG